MTITLTEFQAVVRTPTAHQIASLADQHYLIGDMWTDGIAAFWGKVAPKQAHPPIAEHGILDYLNGMIARCTSAPLALRGVRQEKDAKRPMIQAILETEAGQMLLLNAKYLAYALKGVSGATFRTDPTDARSPVTVFGAEGQAVALIMPMMDTGPADRWQTIAGQGLTGWEPPPPPTDDEINDALTEATEEEV